MTQTDSITLKSRQYLPAITLTPDNQTSVVLLSVRLWTARETDARSWLQNARFSVRDIRHGQCADQTPVPRDMSIPGAGEGTCLLRWLTGERRLQSRSLHHLMPCVVWHKTIRSLQ